MSSMRDMYVGIYFRDEASNILDRVNQKMDGILNAFRRLGIRIDDVEADLNSLGRQGTRAGNNIRDGLNEAEDEAEDFNEEVNNSENALESLKNTALGIGGVIAGIFAVDKIVEFGFAAMEVETAFNRLKAKTATTGSELEGLKTTVKDVFRSGFGENITQVADDMAILKNTFKDFTDTQLTDLSKGIYTVTELWDQDFNEVARTVSVLQKNFEGLGETEALDAITYGFQENLDFSGELLDTLREYSPQFAEMGMSLENTMAILKAGTDAGAWNLDKIGDAIKESHLRMGALDKATVEAYESLGFNADEYVSKIAKGGEEGNKAFQEIVGKLMEVEDATERNELATALFGTQYEDLREKVIFSMAEAASATVDFAGATNKAMEDLRGGFGARMTSVWRDLKLGMIEAFQTKGMQNFLGTLVSDIEAAVPSIKSGFQSFADTISTHIVPAYENFKAGLQWLLDNKDTIISIGTGLATGFAAFKTLTTLSQGVKLLSGALTAYRTAGLLAAAAQLGLNTAMLASPITWIAVGIGALVAAGIYLYKNWDTVKEKASELWAKLRENPMMAMVAGPIGAVIALGITLYNNWDTIKTKAGELWTKVQEVFGGIYDWGVSKIQPVVSFFQGLYDKFVSFKDAISNFTPPEWVSKIGGAISSGISKVKNFIDGSHSTGLAKVPFDGYRAELHKGEAVLTAQQSNALRSAGILQENSDGTPSLSLGSMSSELSGNPETKVNGPYSKNSDVQISVPLQFIINASSIEAEKIKKMIELRVPPIVRDVLSDILDSEFQTI